MGQNNQLNISDSVVGAAAVGDIVAVTGSVAGKSPPWRANQERHCIAIRETEKALSNDGAELDPRLFEGLRQFLHLAKSIRVEQKTLTEVQRQMKETLDEVWAAQAAKGLRPGVLPKTLEVAQALAKNPVMIDVVKKIIGV
ncbi:hypothetical protein LZC95_51130 [Pendulispora brunnea]|uniref:Uncharacterized protein n=1 Tax=Pendulispora brunnea TaxID=2905690 RepID=A0ABZ2KBQ9_9BACT